MRGRRSRRDDEERRKHGKESRKYERTRTPQRERSRSRTIERSVRSASIETIEHRKLEREAKKESWPDYLPDFPHGSEDRPVREERKKSFRKDDNKERWGKNEEEGKKKPVENIAKPDFGLSGKLTEELNTYKGVVIKYAEPPEAGKPKRRWRLYPFKGDESLPTLYVHRQSAYLIGRDRKIADLPIDHPSCSKQHAVLQYRIVPFTRDDGVKSRRIRPYIIDLESANGTFINNKKIEPKKYVELIERDVIKFAYSSREYVLLHEHSEDHSEPESDEIE